MSVWSVWTISSALDVVEGTVVRPKLKVQVLQTRSESCIEIIINSLIQVKSINYIRKV